MIRSLAFYQAQCSTCLKGTADTLRSVYCKCPLQALTPHSQSPVRSGLEKEAAENNLFHYSDSHLLRVIDTIATLMASMAPLVSILILYFVQNLGYRLAIVCVFTLAFSTSLSVITKARRIEIFACTAA
jgi:hypothetical protein